MNKMEYNWRNAINNPPQKEGEYLVILASIFDGIVSDDMDFGILNYDVDCKCWGDYNEIKDGELVVAWCELPIILPNDVRCL